MAKSAGVPISGPMGAAIFRLWWRFLALGAYPGII
jgi:hypothetical protein